MLPPLLLAGVILCLGSCGPSLESTPRTETRPAPDGAQWHNHYLGTASTFVKWPLNGGDTPINRWSYDDTAAVRILFTGDQLRISCAARDKDHNLIGSRGAFWRDAHFGASPFDLILPAAEVTPTRIAGNSPIAAHYRYSFAFTKEEGALTGQIMVQEPLLKISSRGKPTLDAADYLDNTIIIKFNRLRPQQPILSP